THHTAHRLQQTGLEPDFEPITPLSLMHFENSWLAVRPHQHFLGQRLQGKADSTGKISAGLRIEWPDKMRINCPATVETDMDDVRALWRVHVVIRTVKGRGPKTTTHIGDPHTRQHPPLDRVGGIRAGTAQDRGREARLG